MIKIKEPALEPTVAFTPEAIKEYLDVAIGRWREAKKNSHTKAAETMASCYIDAYQSVRVSLFGEKLLK